MNLRQQTFVTEYLRFGDVNTAYRNAYKNYTSSMRTIESAGNRLLNKPEIAEAINNAKERIRFEVEEEFKNQVRKELLTVQRKRELLAMIAEGDVYIEHTYKGRDCRMCKQLIKPTFGQMLKAIDMDCKVAGHYFSQRKATPVHTAPGTEKPQESEQSEAVASADKNEKTQQNATTERSEFIEIANKFRFAEGVGGTSETSEPCNCDKIIPLEEIKQLFGLPFGSKRQELVE